MRQLSRLFQRCSSAHHMADQRWTTVIGLEVHAQLASRQKLFSSALVDDEAPPNTMVAPFDRAIPGFLPILNWQCVELAVRAALALGCIINRESYFDRKHYNYPDLPAGYQITQQRRPLAVNGTLVSTTGRERLSIRQIHLEQDTARTYYHSDDERLEMVDLNRCGVGLIEIVTGPEMRSSQEAVAFAKELRQILVDIGTCNGVMAKGHLRFDVNVSVTGPAAPPDAPPMGERVEIKNINTFKGLEKAIQVEAQRQIAILEAGGRVERATRSWDERQHATRPHREKESVADYRFLPEFDLPPLLLEEEFIERVRARLLPSREERIKGLLERGLSSNTANVLINHPSLLQVFKATEQSAIVADFLVNQYLGFIERYGRELDFKSLKLVLTELQKGTISHFSCKEIIRKLFNNECDDALSLLRKFQSNEDDRGNNNSYNQGDSKLLPENLQTILFNLINQNPKRVALIHQGKENAVDFFIGPLMKRIRDDGDDYRIEPKILRQIVLQIIESFNRN